VVKAAKVAVKVGLLVLKSINTEQFFKFALVLIAATFTFYPELLLAQTQNPCNAADFLNRGGIMDGFEYKSCEADRSIYFLGGLFGNVSNVLQGYGSKLLGNMFYVFNIIVLTIGGLVVSYSMIVSSINTAQEGEVMGKKFSSIWIPLRSAAGIALLLPTASGYSLIQALMMQIILTSIHGANAVWYQILDQTSKGAGIRTNIEVDRDLNYTAVDLFASLTCMEMFNSDNPRRDEQRERDTLLNGQLVGVYLSANGQRYYVGTDPTVDPVNATICGSYGPSPKPSQIPNNDEWLLANWNAFERGVNSLHPDAQILLEEDPVFWQPNRNVMALGYNAMAGTLGLVEVINTDTFVHQGAVAPGWQEGANAVATMQYNQAIEQGINAGWLFAGGYYFKILESERPQITLPPILSRQPERISHTYVRARAKANDYINATTIEASSPILEININAQIHSKLQRFADSITRPIRELVYRFLNHLTTGGKHKDPLDSVRQVGGAITATAENIFFGMVLAVFIIMMAACTLSGKIGVCWGVNAAVSVGSLFVTFIIAILWGFGVTMSIFIPMIPYIIFTFTALGWFILVIEAMVASPIIALGLVSPAQEQLGRASPSVMLITSVFLRPVLMLIGFILGARLLSATVSMLNYGFQATVEASVSGLGIFGNLALIMLYVGIFVALVKECFSLIYVLPDKVIRWIGGSPERSDEVMKQVEAAEKSAKEGGELGGKMLQQATLKVQEKGASMYKAAKGKSGAGGKQGSLGMSKSDMATKAGTAKAGPVGGAVAGKAAKKLDKE
jgi:conjugal transfer/type IV secretion protein DotA/TraY